MPTKMRLEITISKRKCFRKCGWRSPNQGEMLRSMRLGITLSTGDVYVDTVEGHVIKRKCLLDVVGY